MFKLVPLRHLKEKLQFRLRLIKIAFQSLTYNEHLSWNYVFDTLMEPAIWFLDTFSKILGPLFVSGCIILVSCVVFIGWYVGLPYYLEHKSSFSVIVAIVLGNYLKINIIFYYCQTYFTHPGQVPSDADKIKTVSTICKKCIHPKPPRAHHCSVCDQCVLKVRKIQKQFLLHSILPPKRKKSVP